MGKYDALFAEVPASKYSALFDESTPAGSGRGTTVDLEGGTPYEDAGTLGALFPATLRQKQVGGGRVARAVATAGDAMSLLPRGVAALGTGLGALSGGRPLSAAYDEAMTELGRTKSEEEGALGLAQNVALDPTTWVPGAQVSKAKFLPALVKTAVQGAAGGVGSAAYQQAAEGEIDPGRVATQGAVSAALGAGTHGLGTAASKGVGRLLKGSAVRNVDIALRPGQFGRKIGYSGENVVKHDLVGSPRQVFELANQKLDELQSAAREIGSKSDETFNTSDIFESVKSTLNPRKNPEGYAKQVALLDDLEKQYSDVFGDVISAPDAMEMRTAIGKQTAFVGRSQGGVKIDPDASWKEDVYNKLYLKAKDDLHSKLGGELKEINRMQSEIIPVKMVAERRIPIAESNQRIGLSDLLTTRIGQGTVGGVIGAGVGAGAGGDDRLQGALTGLAAGAGLAAARRAYGSPAATRAMYGLGSRLAPEVAPAASRSLSKSGGANNRIKRQSVASAVKGDDDPFFSSLLTPAQHKEQQAAIKLQAMQGEPIPQYNPSELLTEQQLQESLMDASPISTVQANLGASNVKASMRRYLGLGNREVNFSKLPAKKQAEINRYAEDIINNPDMRERFIDAGLIGEEQTAVHPDQIIQWLNEVKEKKNYGTVADITRNRRR